MYKKWLNFCIALLIAVPAWAGDYTVTLAPEWDATLQYAMTETGNPDASNLLSGVCVSGGLARYEDLRTRDTLTAFQQALWEARDPAKVTAALELLRSAKPPGGTP
jgi:hypothetical protein